MKKTLTTLVLLVTAAVAGIAVGRSASFGIPAPQGVAKPVPGGISIDDISITDNSDRFFNIVGDYPQFTGMDAINGPIKQMVDSTLAEFKTSSRDNWAARQATLPEGQTKQEYPDKPFDFVLQWQPAQINGKYVSLIVRIDYYNGGANMISQLQTFNYDVENKKIVALADLFPNMPDYLQKVSNYTRQSLASSLGQSGIKADDPMLLAGTEPKLENFRNFTLTPFLATFYWAKYGVAAGAFGEQSVILPLSEIPNLK